MTIKGARCTKPYPATTSVQAKRVEAGIGQDRAMLSQKPGTATTTEGGTATAVPPSSSLWPAAGAVRVTGSAISSAVTAKP